MASPVWPDHILVSLVCLPPRSLDYAIAQDAIVQEGSGESVTLQETVKSLQSMMVHFKPYKEWSSKPVDDIYE